MAETCAPAVGSIDGVAAVSRDACWRGSTRTTATWTASDLRGAVENAHAATPGDGLHRPTIRRCVCEAERIADTFGPLTATGARAVAMALRQLVKESD